MLFSSQLLLRNVSRSRRPMLRYLSTGPKSVKHIVMFRFQPEVTQAQAEMIQKSLLDLPSQVPEIKTYELGVDLLLESGQNHPAGPNRQVCWTVTFESVDHYLTYNESSPHIQFLGKLKPLVEPGSRAAIQYSL